MRLPLNLDLRQVHFLIRDQLGRIQVNVRDVFVENLSPTELQPVSLQLTGEVRMSE
jgi:hypothetical protein